MSDKSTFDRYMKNPEFRREFNAIHGDPRLVTYLGVQGGGKDFSANKLVQQGYVKVAFADALREMAWDVLGWTPDIEDFDRQYNWFKKLPLNDIYRIDAEDDEFLLKKLNEAKGNSYCISGRQFLQNLGVAVRSRDPDFWVKVAVSKIQKILEKGGRVVVTDARFDNEIQSLKSLGSKFIFCDYRSSRYNATDTHESEALAQRLLAEGYKDGQEVMF